MTSPNINRTSYDLPIHNWASYDFPYINQMSHDLPIYQQDVLQPPETSTCCFMTSPNISRMSYDLAKHQEEVGTKQYGSPMRDYLLAKLISFTVH